MRPGGSADVRELSVLEVGRRALLGAAIATAAAWVFVPAETAQVVVAVVLPLVAAAASWYGGREVGAVAAVTGAIWFGFAHTVPRFHFEIEARAALLRAEGGAHRIAEVSEVSGTQCSTEFPKNVRPKASPSR